MKTSKYKQTKTKQRQVRLDHSCLLTAKQYFSYFVVVSFQGFKENILHVPGANHRPTANL